MSERTEDVQAHWTRPGVLARIDAALTELGHDNSPRRELHNLCGFLPGLTTGFLRDRPKERISGYLLFKAEQRDSAPPA